MSEPRSALVLGATGLVGGLLLDLLLDDPAWRRVVVLGRRPVDREHPKLEQATDDLGRMEAHADAFRVDAVFCCLGTTLAKAGSREAFRRVDFELVAESARLAARGGAGRYLLVTAAGSSPRSLFFYSRVKGEAEAAVRAAGVPAVAILRPSQILGDRDERRRVEAVAQRASRIVAPLLVGPLRRLRPVPARVLALALARVARELPPGVRVVENEEILEIGG